MRRFFLFVLLGFTLGAARAPDAQLWPRWERHDATSGAVIDHAAWGQFLKTYLHTDTSDGIVRIAYGAVTPQDRQALEADVQRQAAIPIDRYNPGEQLAYWTNLYNELIVMVVLQHYPVESIEHINLAAGWFGSGGPWDKKLVQVEGTGVSLNDIRNRILRPIWRDARTLYALDDARLGSPNLQTQPFTADNMEMLLERGARQFVNSPRGAAVDDGRLTVSSLYLWYEADFGGTDHGVIGHLKRWADAQLAERLATVSRIAADHFDDRLNDATVH